MRQFGHILVICTLLIFSLSACKPDEVAVEKSDFAVLTQGAEGFAQARPGEILSFPRDHGPHPGFRIEWWYLTANLNDLSGKTYGAQWTLFRLAVRPPETSESANPLSVNPLSVNPLSVNPGQNEQVFMAHFAITTPTEHVSFQRYSRGDTAQDVSRAGVSAEPFSAWLDDWVLQSTGSDWMPMEVHARQDDDALQLDLQSSAPLILQGEAGFSQKHPDGGGSFYYSQPFLTASGELTIDGRKIPVSGEAWLDREWGSQFLQRDQLGWDWFSLHLENGEKLMLFQLRHHGGKTGNENFSYGSLMSPDGSRITLDSKQIQLTVLQETVVAGRNLPMRWRLDLPQLERQLDIEALHPRQWMDVDFPYWEGVITVNGNGPANQGRGYMELTGYPLQDNIRP